MKLLFDFFPLVLFFLTYRAVDIYAATGVLIGAVGVQLAASWIKNRRVETIHVVTFGVALVFGGATILLRNPVFIKWKPTIAYWILAVVFLGSQYVGRRSIVRRMLGSSVAMPDPLWARLNVAWVAFFVLGGVLNLFVAYRFSEAAWVNFKVVGLTALTVAFAVAQGVALRRYFVA